MKRFLPIVVLIILVTPSARASKLSRLFGRHAAPSLAATAINPPMASAANPLSAITGDLNGTLTRLNVFASPKYVADANAAMQVAGTTDPILTNCLATTLDIGRDLQANPLALPDISPAPVDPSCLLCLLALKRKLANDVVNGTALAQIQTTQARIHTLRTKFVIGCAPLGADEASVFGLLTGH
jgi:hypothetical protein